MQTNHLCALDELHVCCCSFEQQVQDSWKAVAVKIFPAQHRKHGERELDGLHAVRGLPHVLQMVEYFCFTPAGVLQDSLYIVTE